MYDWYCDYEWRTGDMEYPVYYVFRVEGYTHGFPFGRKVARVLSKEQAERFCNYFNKGKEVA